MKNTAISYVLGEIGIINKHYYDKRMEQYKSLRCSVCYQHKILLKCSVCTCVLCYECYFNLRKYKCPQCRAFFYYEMEEGDQLIPNESSSYQFLLL